jgi:hypothetical protein
VGTAAGAGVGAGAQALASSVTIRMTNRAKDLRDIRTVSPYFLF